MKYDKEIVERICQMISTDSYTIAEICRKVKIDKTTFYRWKDKNATFATLLKKGKDEFDKFILSEAEKSLVKLIQGYTVQETTTVTNGTGKRLRETVTEKYFQPVTAAVIFALTNRDPERWKNRQNTDLTTGGEKINQVTIFEIPDNGRDK